MQEESAAPFYPLRIAIGTLFLMLTAAGFGGYALSVRSAKPYHVMIPVLLLEAFLVLKWAAPLIPWKQVALATATVFAIHLIVEHVVLLLLLAEILIEAVCAAGFGASWVRRGYIPLSANRW